MQSKSQKAEISDASGAPVVSVPARTARKAIAPLKFGYSDGSGLDSLTITDAVDEPVVWGRTGLDPEVSGVESAAIGAKIIHRFNSHDALVKALEAVLEIDVHGFAVAPMNLGLRRRLEAALASSREVRS